MLKSTMIMNRKIIYGIIIVAIVIIGASLILFKFPFNFSGDPFGASPKETSPNCGPEDRYKFNETINSKDDFVNFIKNNETNQWVRLDNFKDAPNGEVNWNSVLTATIIEKVGSRTIYVLDYNPQYCSGFTLKMTNDGYLSVYGCCGK